MAIDETVTRETSLRAIRSWFDDEWPTADEVNESSESAPTYARGMLDLHMSLFGYDGDLDITEIRTAIWDELFPVPGPRYWIHDSVQEDQPDVGMPFGTATVGIVDEEEGGVILYVHKNSAPIILDSLRRAELDSLRDVM